MNYSSQKHRYMHNPDGTSFTPWVADGHLIVCAGDASALIADCSSASENAEENAAFIVKACNTYAEREELLTAACAALLATNGEPGHTNCPAGVASIIQRIRAL